MGMKTPVNRCTVDLSRYPDLVVVYLGMRVKILAGINGDLPHDPLSVPSWSRRHDPALPDYNPMKRRGRLKT